MNRIGNLLKDPNYPIINLLGLQKMTKPIGEIYYFSRPPANRDECIQLATVGIEALKIIDNCLDEIFTRCEA